MEGQRDGERVPAPWDTTSLGRTAAPGVTSDELGEPALVAGVVEQLEVVDLSADSQQSDDVSARGAVGFEGGVAGRSSRSYRDPAGEFGQREVERLREGRERLDRVAEHRERHSCPDRDGRLLHPFAGVGAESVGAGKHVTVGYQREGSRVLVPRP